MNKINEYSKTISLMDLKIKMIDEHVRLKSSNNNNKPILNSFYNYKDNNDYYEIKVAKPGKETRKDDKKNIYDSKPLIFKNSNQLDNDESFQLVYKILQEIFVKDRRNLEAIGALFVRNAFLVDHGEIKPGIIRYKPPSKKTLPILYKKLFNIPLIVLIYYIELIALNEDVKYYYDPRGYNIANGYGRRNNLLTYSHVAGVVMNKIPFQVYVHHFQGHQQE